MILHLQKIVFLAKYIPVSYRSLLRTVIVALSELCRNLTGKTGAERYNSLMVLLQHLHIDPRLIVKALGKSSGHDLGQSVISQIILRQKDEVIISVITLSNFPVKS